MSESGWLQLATLIVSSASGLMMVWLRSKFNSDMKERNDVDRAVHDKVEAVLTQNDEQGKKLDTIHDDINGRVADLIASKVKEQVAAAVQSALNAHIAAEKADVRERAAQVLDTAKNAALELIVEAKKA